MMSGATPRRDEWRAVARATKGGPEAVADAAVRNVLAYLLSLRAQSRQDIDGVRYRVAAPYRREIEGLMLEANSL